MSKAESVEELPRGGSHGAADARVHELHQGSALQALSNPIRVQVLGALRTPASAAGVARVIGQPRQLVNYHLKELERAGLVQRTGERRVGNFVETLYRSVARAFVVSPRVAWGDPRRLRALRQQHSLERLVLLGERLGRDAAVLLDRAAFDGEEIASASVEAEASFATEEDRAAFLQEYVAALGPLLKKHGSRRGSPYRVVVAVYPDPSAQQEEEKEDA